MRGLTNKPHPWRSQGRAYGELLLAAHATYQQEIGKVGAGDQQNESGDPQQQLQTLLVLVAQIVDAARSGTKFRCLSSQVLAACSTVIEETPISLQPLVQFTKDRLLGRANGVRLAYAHQHI